MLIRPIKKAPFAAVDDEKGKPVDLAERLKGKVVLLNFWATWCEPCLEEMPAIERLSHAYRERGLVVLAVSVDREGAAVVRTFLKRHALSFLVGLDPQQAVARLYRIWALPSTVIVSRKGIPIFSVQGAREWDGPAGHALFRGLMEQDP